MYLRTSLPCPIFHSIFDVLGTQVDSAGLLDICFYFFDFLQHQVHDQPLCSFSVTPPFPRGVFQSYQNTLQEHLDCAKVTSSSLHEGLFVFFGKYFIGISSKPSDILSTTCMSSISFSSSAVVVLLPFGESPLMTLTSILKKLEFLYAGESDPRLYLYNVA